MTPQQKRMELAFGIRDLKPKTEVSVQKTCLETAGLPVPADTKKLVTFTAEELTQLIGEANATDEKAAAQAEAEAATGGRGSRRAKDSEQT